MTVRTFHRGFTLIELMVTLAVGAVLLVVAAPSFLSFQRNSELTSLTNSMLSAINAARAEAMKTGHNALVVPIDGASWTSGWVVFVDSDRTGTYLEANDITVSKTEAPPSYIDIGGNGTANETAPYIMFNSSGYSRTKANAFGALTLSIKRNDVAAAEEYKETRRLIVASTGRTRTCKPSAATDTNCATSSTN